MPHSLWWLLGQFALVMAAGAAMIAAVIAVWYGLSFLVLLTVGRVFPLRGGKWTPADHDPTGGPTWGLKSGSWSMSLTEVEQARARLTAGGRDDRDRTCAAQGHAWTPSGTGNASTYCGRCFSVTEVDVDRSYSANR